MTRRGVGRPGDPRTWTAVATAVTGLSGYLTLVVVAKVLPPSEYADFLAVWSVLFGLFTVIGGVGLHAAASVTQAQPASGRLRVLRLAVRLSAPVAVVGALVGLVLSGWFALPGWALPAVVAVAVGGYLVQTMLMGSLAGLGRWRDYGLVISAEGTVRLLAVLLVAVLVGSLTGLAFAVAAATLSWLLLLALPGVRGAWSLATAGERAPVFLRRSAQTAAGSLGPAILIVGYPALVKSLVSPEVFATAAGTLLAVVLTRAPFLVPLAVVQPAVVSRARRGADVVVKVAAAVLAVGLVGAVAGAAVGPWILGSLGEEYRVSGWLVALLVVDASLLAVMMLVAALRLAEGRRRTYVLAWGAAVVVAVVFLLAPWSLDLRVGLGLLGSPVVGTVVLLLPSLHGAVRGAPRPGARHDPLLPG